MENPQTMLPVEILERILQDLDSTSIKSCSLVPGTLHYVARSVLFQKVALSLDPDRRVSDAGDSGAQFLQFLLEDPEVASFIRRLFLDQKQSSRADDSISDWQSNADKLIRLLPKLTRLKDLSIQSNFFSDWTLKNNDLRGGVMRLCLLPQLQSLQLSFIHLQQSELSPLASIPKLTLFCIDATPDPLTSTSAKLSTALSSRPSNRPSIQLRDLTITAKYSDDRLSAVWSTMKMAASNLTSLRIYSSPYDDYLSSSLDNIDLGRHPSLLFLAISIPLTSSSCIEKLASVFSPSSGKIECIEICCDVDLYSLPSRDTINAWDWASLDTVLSSNTYENLEHLQITVKKVIRSRTSWQRQRKYKDLEGMLVELFRDCLPVVSEKVLIVAGPSVEYDR